MSNAPDHSAKYTGWLAVADRVARALFAGLGVAELAAIWRGDPPAERPNPRYRVHVQSLLFHIRPRTYPAASLRFTHTFRLGFLTVLFFIIEVVTGMMLMVYYVPSPDAAYESIWRIMSAVPFGEYVRDIHRLAAEAMVVTCALHMVRVFWTGSYKQQRVFTWITGVLLLILTLGLAFSGYLLPWDQLAYWAVTIGTSIAGAVPAIGPQLTILLRGAPDIGLDGLLRFYLLHILLLPTLVLILLSVHYYRVARIHGISLPAWVEERRGLPRQVYEQAMRKIDFLPGLLAHEVIWTLVVLLILLVAAVFWYDAPLEHHANPLRTPLESQAPWFFLWVQGLLKLGDKVVWGVLVTSSILAFLFGVPYLDPGPRRMIRSRLAIVAVGALLIVAIFVLTYIGTPRYGLPWQPAVHIGQELLPEEGKGLLRAMPFEQLQVGYYEVGVTEAAALPPELGRAFAEYARLVREAEAQGQLPAVRASMTIQDHQVNLRRVTLRIQWLGEDGQRNTYEQVAYIHRDRSAQAESPFETR